MMLYISVLIGAVVADWKKAALYIALVGIGLAAAQWWIINSAAFHSPHQAWDIFINVLAKVIIGAAGFGAGRGLRFVFTKIANRKTDKARVVRKTET